ncbi:MAG TPA: hypothetical protein VF658_07725 [Pyrinomonadaceae bacterium]
MQRKKVILLELKESGCHDPQGRMMLYGPGIKQGEQIAECNNLDIAPTILNVLGVPLPSETKGRMLSEAFSR